ncbi:hypothetical protein F2Q69_00010941 [Brassica cretica]|uniref:Uncharacterized protein n=1 Tax=Brassica cretica TaxID=69181 RepID=A0A8S9QKQ1_BRACR|nr:hypothetical protein F2Q69_00010941 [Brassica cretica]
MMKQSDVRGSSAMASQEVGMGFRKWALLKEMMKQSDVRGSSAMASQEVGMGFRKWALLKLKWQLLAVSSTTSVALSNPLAEPGLELIRHPMAIQCDEKLRHLLGCESMHAAVE